MKNSIIMAAIIGGLVALAHPAAAFLGTDISGDYAYSDSLSASDPDSPAHSFESIASTGSSGPTGDDNTTTASLGFDFEFYGVIYDSVIISTNGFITFDTSMTGSGCCSGNTIPTSGNVEAFVAGAWTDLSAASGNIYYETRGIAPSRRFIVEYNNVNFLSGAEEITFQIELLEGSDSIYIHYESDGNGTRDTTIGIENGDGTDGIEYLFGYTNTVDLENQTVVFFPRRDAPRISIVTEEPSIVEGGSVDLEVTAIDRQGDPVTIEWDLDLDGDYDDATGETVTISGEGLDGPSTLSIGIRASDPSDNFDARIIELPVLNAPPVLSSPTEVEVLIRQELTYEATAEDPGGDVVTVEVLDRPAGMVLLAGGGVRWTPNAEDVGDHVLTFIATDDDDDPDIVGDGEAVLVVTITVVANQGPMDAPVLVSPERGEDITEARPTFVVENPTDPEGDTVFIAFEVDVTDTFTNPISSGPLMAGSEGTTTWSITEDLDDGTRYYWRACASDDSGAQGHCNFSYFRIEIEGAGDGGPDGGPEQDGGTNTIEPGCSCTAIHHNPAGTAGSALLILLTTLALIWIRKK